MRKLIIGLLLVIGVVSVGRACEHCTALAVGNVVPAKVKYFGLKDVRLLDSPFKNAMDRNAAWMLEMDMDRLLSNFLKNAGLEPKGESYGSWESMGIAGHTLGHYLSAVAQQYASTGDERFKQRVDYIVHELDSCQQYFVNGFIGGMPGGDRVFKQVKKGIIRSAGFDLNGLWVPWYNEHKTMMGLNDAYLLAGNKTAKKVLVNLADYLVDVLEPEEEFHIVKFQEMAKAAMEEIYAKGKVPILVGGTGFYIQAVTRDIDFTEAQQENTYRAELEKLAEEKGAEYLHERLREVDPASAESIHANNVKRVIRALEFYHQNGTPISAHNEEQKKQTSPYNLAYFVLNAPRDILYERIDKRVDQMLEEGLVKEVEGLKREGCHRGMVSMQGLGYKEILAYLEGEYPLEEAVRILKRDTRHFAKRQLTWFRRESDVIWVDKDKFHWDEKEILEYMLSVLKEHDILG